MKKIERIIKKLDLKPHPEGGFFRETYRNNEFITSNSLDSSYGGSRNYSTCIYFLLTSDTFSAFHRIKQDEIWHFYEGSPIVLHVITENGKHEEHHIGRNFDLGQVPQLVVTGGDWFASKVMNENSYALVGCTVSPGFDFQDFELPTRQELLKIFPQHKELIMEFTRE